MRQLLNDRLGPSDNPNAVAVLLAVSQQHLLLDVAQQRLQQLTKNGHCNAALSAAPCAFLKQIYLGSGESSFFGLL
jgi:hypothetical protein